MTGFWGFVQPLEFWQSKYTEGTKNLRARALSRYSKPQKPQKPRKAAP
jgi:hypothetical protein